MTDLNLLDLAAVTGGNCYDAVLNIFGLEIGLRIGSCQMN